MKNKNILFDRAFDVSLFLKGFDGIIETIGGLFVLLTPTSFVIQLTQFMSQEELGEDPHDIVANFIMHLGDKFGSVHVFAAVYLLVHGLVKIGLVIYLLRRITKVYPWAIGIFTAFTVYQIYLLIQTFSLFYILLTILDIAVIGLVWWEYRQLRPDGKF
jgi:uncharacterized membrane protein